jgi:poly-gamma-glutamate capsule biosynthesis protein CapA/YwtB (metallophosphatase superfamily)
MSRLRLATLGLALCFALPAGAEGPTAGPTVTLAFVGDINLDGLPGRLVRRGGDPFAPFAALLAGADIRVGNLECAVATRGEPIPKKPYTFRAHPRTLNPLKRHFDAVSLANNHSGDFGPAAFGELLALLDRHGIAYFGGGADLAQAHRPLIVERHGLRVALLGYDEFLPRSFEADYDRPGVAWSEDEQVQYDIAEARRRYRADLVVPFMHWGWENEPVAGQRQRRLARLMIDAGADAVVGGHPHVIQDTEAYRGRPIVYSLGDFVFDGFSKDIANTGWLLRLELDRKGARAWRTDVAHIDRRGIPHPAPATEGICWERGQAEAGACGAR